jgi:hypothetical protein
MFLAFMEFMEVLVVVSVRPVQAPMLGSVLTPPFRGATVRRDQNPRRRWTERSSGLRSKRGFGEGRCRRRGRVSQDGFVSPELDDVLGGTDLSRLIMTTEVGDGK